LENEDLRSSIESAFDAVETSDVAVVETPATFDAATGDEVKSESAGRVRDEAGRFAPKAADQAAPVDAAPVAGETPQQATRQAPSSWKKEAAAEFAKLPPHVQDEVLRREGDFHKGIEGFKSHADAGRAYQKAIEPYQETLKSLGVDGVTAVTELMKADHILRNAPDSVKVQKLLELAHVYRIDLQKQFSPDVARYEHELFQTREQLKNLQSQTQESANASLNSEIDRFKSAPGHELFEEVRVHMASLLSGGVAQDLEDAYQQAVFANPQTRTSLLEQQRAKAAEESRAQRARAASGSVRGSSPASGSSNVPGNSIRDAVSAAFDAHS
jgi:hypothetical protein